MSLTPDDIERVSFKRERRGYAEREVDVFLDRVHARLRELATENAELRERLGAADTGTSERADVDALLSRTLVLAQRTADDAIAAARSNAERVGEEATARAEELVRAAHVEAAAIVSDARARVSAEVEVVRAAALRTEQAVRELQRFRAGYRDRVHAVIAEQLALLEGSGDIPEVGEGIVERAQATATEAKAAAELLTLPCEPARPLEVTVREEILSG